MWCDTIAKVIVYCFKNVDTWEVEILAIGTWPYCGTVCTAELMKHTIGRIKTNTTQKIVSSAVEKEIQLQRSM